MNPNRFQGFPATTSWKSHQSDVNSGADVVGFRFIEDVEQQKITSTAPAKFPVRQLPFPPLHNHPFGEDIAPDLAHFEKHTAKNTRKYLLAKRSGDLRRMRIARTRQTEIIGEFTTMRRMTKMRDAKPLMPIRPGHGTGIDQMWESKRRRQAWVVEAKGPMAKLQPGQMTDKWITSRIKSQANSRDARRAKSAKRIQHLWNKGRVYKTTQTSIEYPGHFSSSGGFKKIT
ncbi:hypothetical protein GCM10008090_33800 [Arenicella chitinivorans]|uniref:Uncharacterized protein n=1 Tax=Arenicella chitinivorans TaxID=1329800 RepID=A0A918VST2_9GAMM|nr:hypothetical protein [Arenicella chitinivorans]GHA21085.1 hypothetical protein GCM10008090_33800 [Arenicella chitinivorans]